MCVPSKTVGAERGTAKLAGCRVDRRIDADLQYPSTTMVLYRAKLGNEMYPEHERRMTPGRTLVLILAAAVLAGGESARADDGGESYDLTDGGPSEWLPADGSRWQFRDGSISGRTPKLDGAKTDPAASAFLESRRVFGGNKSVDVELDFEAGRYFGIYFDYDPATESGIWMATGHFLSDEEQVHNVESAYIKTVDDGHWVVRATGELEVPADAPLDLRFEREGDDYRIWQGDRLVVTYRKPGGYPPGKLRLRLVNSAARIPRLAVSADTVSILESDGP